MYIIASVGPKYLDEIYLKKIIESGAKYLRVSFSHLDHKKILPMIKFIRNNYKDIKIIGDLQGNKIRVSNKLESVFKVYEKEEVYFCGEDGYELIKKCLGKNNKIIPLNIKGSLLHQGDIHTIFMKDGTMKFEVIHKKGEIIKAKVILAGVVRKEKGCNIPKINRENMGLTNKDKSDIDFCLDNELDIILYSYTCYKKNVEEIKSYIKNMKDKGKNINIWSKIETLEGVENIRDILELSDGIMLGRGDLLPESNMYMLPLLQKKVISIMKNSKKDLVIATHILDNMKDKDMPTINEIEGIFNLCLSKVNGVLLAGETTVGNNPYRTVKILDNFIKYYENVLDKI